MSLRAVFATNVVLSALLFTNGQLAWLRTAWERQLLTPVVSKETIEDLLRVLSYPKFQLSREDRNDLLAEYLPVSESLVRNENQSNDAVPLCRDNYDQKFLNLAYQSNVKYLVTGDKDLLELNEFVEFEVITASQLKTQCEPK